MSVEVMGLVFKHYPGQGGELVLALSLADHAHDDGTRVFPSVDSLAIKTRQSPRTVQRQLRAMQETGWLELVTMTDGGRAHTNLYRINPAWIAAPEGFKFGAKMAGNNPVKMSPFSADKPRQNVTVRPSETVTSGALNGDIAVSPEPSKNHHFPPLSPPSSENPEDRKLAAWIFEKLKGLNPEHRPPAWARWCRDLRAMRTRDGRTHRQIAELFAWANADPFWQANVLSPAKLRQQWDQLVIKRAAAAKGSIPATTGPLRKACRWPADQGGCTRDGARQIGNRLYCHEHADEMEREGAHV